MADAPPAPERAPRFTVRKVQRKRKSKPSIQILTDPKIEAFFRGREKDPLHYTYTPEGNYRIFGARDVKDEVIRRTQVFTPMTAADYEDLMEARQNALVESETTYDSALKQLRSTLERYSIDEATAEEVVVANTTVMEASKSRSEKAYPERWITSVKNPETRQVLLNYEPNEQRKIGYNVFLLKHNELGRKVAWGKYTARQAGGGEEEQSSNIRIRFITDINDPSTGHLHPFYQRNFVFNETEYCCPVQAYEGERFKELGNEDLRRQILGTRSGRTIHSIAIKDKSLPNQPQKLWEDILFHFYYSHPDLRKELEATGTDKFHVMDKEVPPEYGQALERARARLRELGDNQLDDQEVKEKAITEEEQKKAKVGAIVNNFRKKF